MVTNMSPNGFVERNMWATPTWTPPTNYAEEAFFVIAGWVTWIMWLKLNLIWSYFISSYSKKYTQFLSYYSFSADTTSSTTTMSQQWVEYLNTKANLKYRSPTNIHIFIKLIYHEGRRWWKLQLHKRPRDNKAISLQLFPPVTITHTPC